MTEQENYHNKIFKHPMKELRYTTVLWTLIASFWITWAGAFFALDVSRHHRGWQIAIDVFLWAILTALLCIQIQIIALRYGRSVTTNILDDLRESLFDTPEEDKALRRTAKTKRNKA